METFGGTIRTGSIMPMSFRATTTLNINSGCILASDSDQLMPYARVATFIGALLAAACGAIFPQPNNAGGGASGSSPAESAPAQQSLLPDTVVYPLKASAKRALPRRSNNRPFLMVGDAPQTIVSNVTMPEAAAYVANTDFLFLPSKAGGSDAECPSPLVLPALCPALLAATMNQKSSLREVPQFESAGETPRSSR
jgi:hypothetical protein